MEMSVNSYGKRNWSDHEYVTGYTNPLQHHHHQQQQQHQHQHPHSQHYNDDEQNNNLSCCLTDHFNPCSTIHDHNNNEQLTTTTAASISSSTVSTLSSPQSPSYSQPPIKRVANERERTRTASVNDAFLMLRSLIPTEPINRKLSKIETLRLASSYISHLHAILVTGSGPADQPCLRHQQIHYTSNDTTNTTTTNTTIDKDQLIFDRNKRYRPVCTFCVTEMKHHQRIMNKESIISSG
ncbi:Basic helix-loop-helix transcription factor scleraxis [Schistosoma japonicum]|nr:Basic helix-loop-helix transcription factor scleraxis [Schistosoma japonicum]